MKQFHFSILMIAMLLLFSACGKGVAPVHMMFKDDPAINVFNIKPDKGKAALVVARTYKNAATGELETFLDKKMIGNTKGQSYFVMYNVAPGIHYVIMRPQPQVSPGKRYTMTLKTNFLPDRVYYIYEVQHLNAGSSGTPYIYPNSYSRTEAFVTPEELSTIFDDECKRVVYDTANPGDDMSDSEYRDAVNDYEQQVKEGLHKQDAGYNGVPAK